MYRHFDSINAQDGANIFGRTLQDRLTVSATELITWHETMLPALKRAIKDFKRQSKKGQISQQHDKILPRLAPRHDEALSVTKQNTVQRYGTRWQRTTINQRDKLAKTQNIRILEITPPRRHRTRVTSPQV